MTDSDHPRESSPAAASDRYHNSGADSDSLTSRRTTSSRRNSVTDSHPSPTTTTATATGGHREDAQRTAPIDVPGRRQQASRRAAESEEENESDEHHNQTTAQERRQQRRPERQADEERPTQRVRGSAVAYHSSPPSPQLRPTIRSSISLNNSGSASPAKIVVRDLNHIQSFASEEMLTRSRQNSRRSLHGRIEGGQQYEISSMPVSDIIEMVAGLLTKITTTNDRPHQHESIQRHLPNSDNGHTATQQQTQSVLSFHGRNIPSITILSYLSRIHRYCPTTYEVFLSLLVYFDRMTGKINNGTLQSFRSVEAAFNGPNENGTASAPQTPPGSGAVLPQDDAEGNEQDASLVDSDDEADRSDGHIFVVDSFNIHRLVIAGVTCASKFFSDVFYTNSRYAKVGGLPIHELNHLELQFLLLNDFRLSIPVEELEAYGSRLVEFYAREVVAQQMGSSQSSGQDALYMHTPNPTP